MVWIVDGGPWPNKHETCLREKWFEMYMVVYNPQARVMFKGEVVWSVYGGPQPAKHESCFSVYL